MWDGQEPRRHYPRMAEIKEVVARHNGLTVADLESACRQKRLAWPRQIAQYLCRELTLCSYPEIGRAFGDRHHTTAIFAHRKVEHVRNHQPATAEAIAAYEAEIHAVMIKRVEAEQANAIHYAPPADVKTCFTFRRWDGAELAEIAACALGGVSVKAAAAKLPHRSLSAIKEKLRLARSSNLAQAEAVS